jgi:hypothetical protein
VGKRRRYPGGLLGGFWNSELRIELAGLSHEPITLDTELRTLDVALLPVGVVVSVVVVVVVVVPVGGLLVWLLHAAPIAAIATSAAVPTVAANRRAVKLMLASFCGRETVSVSTNLPTCH